ncbi:uncharacterized protein LOC130894228 isoform X2 [Diorhabda carinulata]|uniref:uncharacterized protein LOC130894228 isoform X2 n=1 Tax=Diorhabda carinulata TaxID=1163345 RepID=UPI0025A2D34D|nr:uncharacterized protein LOC130894228 isoform X2 [Diorhabda carinulata]
MVSFAAAGAISLTISNWNRFSANPTVVSIEKDYRNWENDIPAVTGCFNDKVDIKKADKYILEKWKIKLGHPKYDHYMDFIKLVANLSYENLYYFEKFKNDVDLHNVDMAQLTFDVHPDITGSLVTVDKTRKFKWNVILIELGICFTFFSKLSQVFTIKNKEYLNETENIDNNLLKCHYLNGLCYARFDSDPTLPIKYYVHSYMEVPDISTRQYHELGKGWDMEINYRMVETLTSPNIRYLTPKQRKCRFNDEPTLKNFFNYSIGLCQMACRYKLAMTFCGCKPYFYQIFEGTSCNVSGLLCLAQYSKNFAKTPLELNCKCPETCHLINYIPDTPKVTIWQSGVFFDQRTTFRWGLLHPTTKYLRDILFGFGDLIVSFGGTLNLFLGISFISIIESIFLICENIIIAFQTKPKRKNHKKISRNVNNIKIFPLIDNFYN